MRYAGGKGKCYQHLINLMPPHDTYIESHLGGGAVLRHKAPARQSIGIDKDPKVIEIWNKRYPGLCQLVQADATEFLLEYQCDGNELIYSDPPYVSTTRRRPRIYEFEYTDNDHQKLLLCLKNLPCMVLISGYDNELYNDLLSGWRKETFQAKTWTGVRKESVWLNFEAPSQLHDSSFIGANYRERQTVKRRQHRLRTHIQEMNPVERNELIQWITATYNND